MQDKDGQLCGAVVRDNLSKRTTEVYARQVCFSPLAPSLGSSYSVRARAFEAQLCVHSPVRRRSQQTATQGW